MLWSKPHKYFPDPFEKEADLESAIQEVKSELFGQARIYLDIKKKIGKRGRKENIPDGYLIDLSSTTTPSLYVVENELGSHHPIKHVALQILEFSLSYQTSIALVKDILKEGLNSSSEDLKTCQEYVRQTQFDNVDHLLDEIVHANDSFKALVIIDELDEDLEKVLREQFRFPVEIITLRRFSSVKGEQMYEFDPFLADLFEGAEAVPQGNRLPKLDPEELDTVIVPAHEEGFHRVFLGEQRWYKIRIRSSMIPKLRFIAGYQVAPISAITHVAKISNIESWQDSGKYVVNFSEPADKITPLKLPSETRGLQPQGPRYANYERLMNAKNFYEVF